MTDHVDLLRVAATFPCDPRHKQLLLESANEIERLREALREISDFSTNEDISNEECMRYTARAALEGE